MDSAKASYTRPYRLDLDEFETPNDRWSPGPAAKDYSVASEGGGQVTARGSDYDIEEPEVFAPSGEHKLKDIRGHWGGDTLGFDAETNLAGEMGGRTQGVGRHDNASAQVGRSDRRDIGRGNLANGGQVHTVDAYRTTPAKSIKINKSSPYASAWAGGTGIPREMRQSQTAMRRQATNRLKNFGATRYDPSFNFRSE